MLQHNPERCVGCLACMVACQQEHSLLPVFHPLKIICRMVLAPRPAYDYEMNVCRHCPAPPCREVCPGEAWVVRDGIVVLDPVFCTGCGACADACPRGAVEMDPSCGLPVKCDLCRERVGENLPPACVQTCPAGALSLTSI
jgi:anaerobic dimethyl sulfoxide reductase subunit B (iron-sulfur subunit)/Tat-targeted selenate reductase subunit YnfG